MWDSLAGFLRNVLNIPIFPIKHRDSFSFTTPPNQLHWAAPFKLSYAKTHTLSDCSSLEAANDCKELRLQQTYHDEYSTATLIIRSYLHQPKPIGCQTVSDKTLHSSLHQVTCPRQINPKTRSLGLRKHGRLGEVQPRANGREACGRWLQENGQSIVVWESGVYVSQDGVWECRWKKGFGLRWIHVSSVTAGSLF